MLPFRLPPAPRQAPTSFLSRFLNVIYFSSVPASFLSEPRQTPTRKSHNPQCKFVSKTAHLQCCSAHFNFRADTAPCIAGGYAAWNVLYSFLSYSYQITIAPLSYSTEAPIQLPEFNVVAHQIPHHISNHLPFQLPQCNLIQFGASQLPTGASPGSYPQRPYSSMQFRF